MYRTGAGAALLLIGALCFASPALAECRKAFKRGDANGDGNLDLSDGIATLGFLFLGGDAPGCTDAADSDDSGTLEITDGIYTFTFLFLGGPPPPAPGPVGCGVDLTDDPLGCITYEPCAGSGECDSNDCCAPGYYCAKPPGECDSPGTCTERPQACPEIWAPVCGCDGQTYGNDCMAAAAGVNVAYEGECRPASDCSDNSECPRGSYCAKAEGDCDGRGTCTEEPLGCPDVWDPVCGCDDQTYGNDCEAAAAGVNVAYRGECRPASDCSDNSECPQESYCAKADGDCDGKGVCTESPRACPAIWDPVCGCDGQTYGNDCEAAAAGVNVQHRGECK